MKRSEIKKLDKLWSKKVKEDAGFRCEVCGKSNDECQLHPHHFWGRRIRATRWLLENGICLCASHHTMGLQSAHESPAWFIKYMRDLRGEEWYKSLEIQSNQKFKGTYQQVLDYLNGDKENYI